MPYVNNAFRRKPHILLRFFNLPFLFFLSMWIVIWFWELQSVLHSIRSLSSLFLKKFSCGMQKFCDGKGESDGADDVKLDVIAEGNIKEEFYSLTNGVLFGE